jgi:3-deoxy-7-phosphoheptulonate synthase
MRKGASPDQISAVVERIETLGFRAHLSQGEERTIIGVIGDERPVGVEPFEILDGVERVVPILQPYKLASKDFRPEPTIVSIGDAKIGGDRIAIIAGPCSIESREQLLETAWAVKEAGASVLRGGAYKPRSSPYSFQGLGEQGLELLLEVGQIVGLPTVTEVVHPADVPLVQRYSSALQIGARNSQNFSLLQDCGRSGHPILLKRGLMSTVQELLMGAEYILATSNFNVILCERGIRTFETSTRFTLDINAVPVLKQSTHLPVIVDPTHSTGKASLVAPASLAAIAAGADGLIIEVHPHPERALSDGPQQIKPAAFAVLMREIRDVARAVGRAG